MIKILKKDGLIYQNIEEKSVNEDGVEVFNIPTDVALFQTMAIDTINWVIGDNIKKAVGNTFTTLSASNSKAIALLAKIVNGLAPDTSSLTTLEADNFTKLVALGDGGYGDSELLNASLTAVDTEIAAGTDKITRITNATTIDEVIAILNEV